MAKKRRGPKPHFDDPTANLGDPVAIPSNIRDFVGRAKHLVDDSTYKQATNLARDEWNARFPECAFAKTDRDEPPDLDNDSGAYRVMLDFPPKLERKLPKNYWEISGRIRYHGGSDLDDLTQTAHDFWYRRVLTMCREWWPDPPYTVWCNPRYEHPAMRFVAASIIWNIEPFADDNERLKQWVQPLGNISYALLPFDPTDVYAVTEAIRWRTFSARVIERLTSVISENGSATIGDLCEAANAANDEAIQSWNNVACDTRLWQRPYPVIPLKYGITAADIKAYAVAGESASAHFLSSRNDLIRMFAEDGSAVSEIARRFGLTEAGVRKILLTSTQSENRTVEHIAKAIGMTEESIRGILRNDSDAPIQRARDIAQHFGIKKEHTTK